MGWSGVGRVALALGWALVACGPTMLEPLPDNDGSAGEAGIQPSTVGAMTGMTGSAGALERPASGGGPGVSEPAHGGVGGEPTLEVNAGAGGGMTSAGGAPATSDSAGGASGEGGEGGAGGTDDGPLVVSPEPVIQLASGAYHQCVLYGAGKVKCWGRNDWGQLGVGSTDDRGDDAGELGPSLPDVNLGSGRYAKSINAGWYVTCAILDDDTLKCWGSGGILGTGDRDHRGDDEGDMGDALLPIDLGTSAKPVQVSAGAEHVCVVLDDGSAKCFGWNHWTQLGTPAPDMNEDPGQSIGNEPDEMGGNLPALDVGEGVEVLQVSAGAQHTCVVLSGGVVKCFGYGPGLGNYGQGSYGLPIKDVDAVELGTGRSAKQVVAGYDHSCAILDDDTVKCWGFGHTGATGHSGDRGWLESSTPDMGDALPTVELGTGRHALELQSGGDQHTCALLDNHQLKCWGWGNLARLGNQITGALGDDAWEMGDNLLPLRLGGSDEVESFSTCVHGCALLTTGEVKCWGYNDHGQLGLGDTETRGDDPGEMGGKLRAVQWW